MTDTMRAVVVDEPGPPEVLQLRELPVPKARPAQVLIRVKAFGLNRSELHFRQGVATTGQQDAIAVAHNAIRRDRSGIDHEPGRPQ